jgi:amidase
MTPRSCWMCRRSLPVRPAHPATAPAAYRQEVGVDPGRLRVGLLTSAPDPAVATHAECITAAEEAARLLASLGA